MITPASKGEMAGHICPVCDGVGVVYIGSRGDAKICGRCGGSGDPRPWIERRTA